MSGAIPTGRLAGAPRCPRCDAILDGWTGLKSRGAAPKPGDASVCAYCAAVLLFSKDLGLEEPAPGKLVELLRDPQVARTLAIVRMAIGLRGAAEHHPGGRA